ncbi:hypothetical protein GCM10022247_39790 [Allokutzneria multivorans]|uniref:PspA domain-containing protein n=2 Tax=Allokutzneria multivorans TaxID=1142134 RepID=A0ABP7SKX4_9PSEU
MAGMSEPKEIVEAELVDIAPPPPVTPQFDYDEGGVPTFDYVRDRIEGRTATAAGAAELDAVTGDSADVEQQFAEREQAGRDRLEAIRRSMRGE